MEQLHRVTLEAVTHITKLESRNLIERIIRKYEGKSTEALTATTTATNTERGTDTNGGDTASAEGQEIITDDDDKTTAQR